MKEKKLFLLLTLFAATLLCSNSAYAQKVRYVHTKSIDSNGIERKESRVWYLEFSNNQNTIVSDLWGGSGCDVYYQYHHMENGNKIYYQYSRSHYDGTVYQSDNYLVASPDLSVINDVAYNSKTGKIFFITVYEQQPEPRKGNLYR